jgi:hypothetical protein
MEYRRAESAYKSAYKSVYKPAYKSAYKPAYKWHSKNITEIIASKKFLHLR